MAAFGLAMVHHPLLAAVGAPSRIAAAVLYARRAAAAARRTADALAAPLALALACEQFGALLAGSGYGTETNVPLGRHLHHPFAARWSGTPLVVPLHPVQAYAAVGFSRSSLVALWLWMPRRRQHGDIGRHRPARLGAAIYFTEFWRDPEGRGSSCSGALDGRKWPPSSCVLAGAVLLRQR